MINRKYVYNARRAIQAARVNLFTFWMLNRKLFTEFGLRRGHAYNLKIAESRPHGTLSSTITPLGSWIVR